MSARSKKKGRLSAPAGYAAAANLSEPLQECLEILHFFQNHRDAEAFLQPVDWKLYGLKDYPEIIKHPMDLSTIEQKLLSNTYKDPNAFLKDMRLIWDNCMTYNRPDSDVYLMADKLKKLFEKKIVKVKPAGEGQVKDEGGATNDKSSTKGSEKSRSSHGEKETEREVTRSDRLKFAQCIQQLSPEQLGRLVEMVQNECPMALNEGNGGGENSANEEIEIELNTIDNVNFNIFFTYVNSCLNGTENGTGSMKKQKIK